MMKWGEYPDIGYPLFVLLFLVLEQRSVHHTFNLIVFFRNNLYQIIHIYFERSGQYESKTGTIGLIIFTAADEAAAKEYVSDMCTKYGHTNVYNLSPLLNGTGVDELYRLFPRQGVPPPGVLK